MDIGWDIGSRIWKRIRPSTEPEVSRGTSTGTSNSSGSSTSGKEDGTLWAWGSNSYGQLGVPPLIQGSGTASWEEPRPIQASLFEGRRVIQVACGLYHTACLTADGLVFTWGRNHEFQLGHSEAGKPGRVADLADIPVQQIACGRYHTAVLTTTGAVMEWGWGEVKQPRVVAQMLDTPISQLACGVYTTIALTTDGKVFTWESNKIGKAGYEPQLVQALANKGVIKLACGLWDVMALTDEGEVYTWTDHSWSPYNANYVTPTLVTALSGQGISDIVCGKNTNMALTDEGYVWWWPKGKEEEAKVMEQLSEKGVRALSCGDTHFVALATVGWQDIGTVFTSGKNDLSQLGRPIKATEVKHPNVKKLGTITNLITPLGQDHIAQPIEQLEGTGYNTIFIRPVALTGPWMGLSSDLTNDLAAALHSGQMADLEIIAGGRSFLAHKIILAARCHNLTLEDTPAGTRARMEFSDADPDIFSKFIEFLYQDRCRITDKDAKSLHALAKSFGVPRLARMCQARVRDMNSSELKRLGEEVLEVLHKPLFSDVTFVVDGDKRIYGHKAIVAARCPYFKALWTVGMRESEERELAISEVSADVFIAVLEYIYAGRATFNPDTVVELMSAANHYNLVQLKRRCERYIIEAIDADNVESLCEAGEMYDAPLLVSCCKRFMK